MFAAAAAQHASDRGQSSVLTGAFKPPKKRKIEPPDLDTLIEDSQRETEMKEVLSSTESAAVSTSNAILEQSD